MGFLINPYRYAAAGGSISIRGYTLQNTTNANSFNCPLPVGSVAGDRAVIAFGHGFAGDPQTAGSAWTQIDKLIGTNWNGGIWTKLLHANDISNGFISCFFGGSYAGAAGIIVFNGATSGIRTFADTRNSTGSTSRTVTTGSSPVAGDYAFVFGSARINAAASADLGSALDAKNGTNHSAVLRGGVLGSGGVTSANYTYGASSVGDYQAVVIVQP